MAQYSSNPHIMRNDREPYTLCGVRYDSTDTTSPVKVAKCSTCKDLLAVALLVEDRQRSSAEKDLTTK